MARVSGRKCCRRLCVLSIKNCQMKIIFRTFLAICCAFSLFACDDDVKDESPIAMFIDPSASSIIVVNSGDKCRYHMDFYTTHDHVERLRIESFDKYQGEQMLLDTTWSSKVNAYDFIYTAPPTDRDTLNVRLTFTAWDNAGSTCTVERLVKVANKQVLMAEQSGIVLWAAETGHPGALMFANPSKTYNLITASDSAVADMFVDTDATFANVKLRTNTSAKFVRNNSYDYPAATSVSLQAVYAGSRHDDEVDNLRVNDIVLVGHGDRAEGVLRVTNVIRNGDADERCVQLSFKVLR